MIDIAIDTNTISKLKISHASYKAIRRLVESENLIVNIPYIVKREFETQTIHSVTQDYDKAITCLKSLSRKVYDVAEVKVISDKLSNIDEEIINSAKESNKVFFAGWSPRFHNIDHTQTIDSLEAYFQGTLPFKKIKDKNDIPDSFLCRGIESLKEVNSIENMIVITNDDKVLDNFYKKDGYSLHRTIDDFLNTSSIQDLLKSSGLYLKIKKYVKKPLNLIKKIEQDKPILRDYLKHSVGEFICEKTITYVSMSGDDQEALITSSDDAEKADIDFENPIYYGGDQIGFNFRLTVWVNAMFYIRNHNIDTYHHKYESPIIEYNNRYYEDEDCFHLKVTGIVSIKIDFETFDLRDLELSEDFELPDIQEIESRLYDMYAQSEKNIESIESIEVLY